ncbi:MAG: hypothetical protein ACRDYC_04300 [Acidimicrobiales bacterium]
MLTDVQACAAWAPLWAVIGAALATDNVVAINRVIVGSNQDYSALYDWAGLQSDQGHPDAVSEAVSNFMALGSEVILGQPITRMVTATSAINQACSAG